MRSLGVAAVLAILATPAALAQNALPDPTRTPGALNPVVTQATNRPSEFSSRFLNPRGRPHMDCLGPDREPHLGQRSLCRVNRPNT